MACTKWDEYGLLHCSGELSKQDEEMFSAHLQSCGDCSREQKQYTRERASLFTPDLLEETPSQNVSDAILRAGSQKPRFAGSLFQFFLANRRVIGFSAMTLIVGIGIGMYFDIVLHAPGGRILMGQTPSTAMNKSVDSISGVSVAADDEARPDSMARQADSLTKQNPGGYRRRPSSPEGIVPVDLPEDSFYLR